MNLQADEELFVKKAVKIGNRRAELYGEIEAYPSGERFTAIQQEFRKLGKDYAKLHKGIAKGITAPQMGHLLSLVDKS